MELAHQFIYLKSTGDPVNIYFIGDTHIGHTNFDSEKYYKHIDILAHDPYGHAFFMGDAADGRQPDHKYFDFEQCSDKYPIKSFMKNCYAEFEKSIKHIKHKIIGIHDGNHDKDIKFGFPYIEDICDRLGVKYLGYRALTILSMKPGVKSHAGCRGYTFFTTHGSGGGRKMGAKINRIEDEAQSCDADIYAQGHNHALSFTNGIKHGIYLNKKNEPIIVEREQYFINTGSYLQSYRQGNYSYSEKHSYKPQITGCIRLCIEPRKNIITPEILK